MFSRLRLGLFIQELDWESIAAGLLHDTVEDTDKVTFERIEREFGATVRRIVEGETKVQFVLAITFEGHMYYAHNVIQIYVRF